MGFIGRVDMLSTAADRENRVLRVPVEFRESLVTPLKRDT
jgi:hypothetical protein